MILLQFADLDEIPEDDRELRYALLEAAILWHKVGVHPTAAEATLLDEDERELLAEAYDIVHGTRLHPDDVLTDAVARMTGAA